MKIGISCNVLGRGGGMERHALDLIAGLNDFSHRPMVFARAFRGATTDFDPVKINVRWVPGKLRDYLFSARLASFRRRHPVDILIGCNRTRSADIALCGGTHLGFLQNTGRRLTFWQRRQVDLEKDYYDHASLVIAHSHAMERELRDLYGVPTGKIRVSHPPVDLSRFTVADDDARKAHRRRFGFPEDKVVFVFPSTGHRRKGFDLLAAAFEELDLPILLAVAGRPSGTQRDWLWELGWVDDMTALYQAGDFTIMASDYEPFGLVGVESIACGTALVVSDALGCCEVIDPSVRIDFAKGDLASLKRALAEAVERAATGAHRWGVSASSLTYDPSVSAYVGGLLEAAKSFATGSASPNKLHEPKQAS